MDTVSLGLVVLASLPWISGMVKSIKGPGGTELVFKDLERQTLQAIGAAENANRQAALAVASIRSTQPSTSAPANYDRLQQREDSNQRMQKCIQRYNEIRKTMKRSMVRTTEMTKVVSEMIAVCRDDREKSFPVRAALHEEDRGKRLAAYVSLYVNPQKELLENLAKSVANPDNHAFGQYWGIQAIGSTLSLSGKIPTTALNELKKFLASLDVGTDRHFALSGILHDYLEAQAPSGFIKRAAARAGIRGD